MKLKSLSWGLAGAAIALFVLSVAAQKGEGTDMVNGQEAVANEVLVKFRDASFYDIEIAKMRGGIVHAKKIGGIEAYRFKSSLKSVKALVDLYAGDPRVEYVEPNYIVWADRQPNDPLYGNLWGLEKVHAPAAWDGWEPEKPGSRDITVGVVDTGIDYTHPDLAANVWSAPFGFTATIGGVDVPVKTGDHGYDAISGACNPMDDNNHGSHVSGTIGAVGDNGTGVAGVNWNASLMGLKFLDNRGSGSTADAIDAIEFAIQANIAGAANVRILSNSWGGISTSRALLEEIERAYASNILFVCSAGNWGRVLRNEYPSTYNVPNIVAVAASTPDDRLADFSNYGNWSVHLAAPGVNVLSTVRRGRYGSMDGTSMAAPHVSGVAALVAAWWLKQGVVVDVDHLRGILINSAEVIGGSAAQGAASLAAPAAKVLAKRPPAEPLRPIFGNVISDGRLDAARAVATDPTGPLSLFPDFVMRFQSPEALAARPGDDVYFDLTLTSYFGYGEEELVLDKECCREVWPYFADLSLCPDPGTADFTRGPFSVSLAPGQSKTIRMWVHVPETTTLGASLRFTVNAIDYRGSGETGPCLYHNDTVFVIVPEY